MPAAAALAAAAVGTAGAAGACRLWSRRSTSSSHEVGELPLPPQHTVRQERESQAQPSQEPPLQQPGSTAPVAAAPAQPSGGSASSKVLEELLQEVGRRSKAVLYVVSNKTNDQFSVQNLTTYLRQKGVEVHEGETREETAEVNARRLLELLDKRAAAAPGKALVQAIRHELVASVLPQAELEALFPTMKEAYVQQPLDYGRNSRYADNWRISCYTTVMESWKPKIEAHEPMRRCMSEVIDRCCDAFAKWYCRLKLVPAIDVHVMNGFVTRYRPIHGENELQRHIDGASVDGSVVLALPTDDPFEGGKLHVWDGKPQQEYEYAMKPGDAIFLDNAVWHQAKPITTGTRWALVLFIRLRNPATAAAVAAAAQG